MLVSYRWLQEYVTTTTPPLELGERFRMTSSELDDFRDFSAELEHIVVGKVLSVAKHPQADRLHVTKISIGSAEVQVVCGGTNLREGMHVPLALPGSTVHPLGDEPFSIGESTIRGEKSQGMICAVTELGINLPVTNRDIWDLDTLDIPLQAGKPLAEALGLDDTLLQLEVTPNRPDLLSHFGLAREVAAFEHKKLREPEIAAQSNRNLPNPAKISLEPSAGCERFSTVLFTVTSVMPSPWWMQRRLLLCNIRPINAIVDVTNYVMLELGQPLHAYDADALETKGSITFTVRAAKAGETIELLDGSTRNLQPGDVIITDGTGNIVDLCGIMGGKSSAITTSTKRVLLEAAHFEPGQIRRTSRRLGLRSEASSRFEKGVDSENTVTALKRATELYRLIGVAEVASHISDDRAHQHRSETPPIELDFAHLQDVLGVRIPPHEAKLILQQLGFTIRSISKARLVCAPPSWRRDVRLTEDVIEEVGRIWGFERIPTTLPTGAVKAPARNHTFALRNRVRLAFSALGGTETLHVPFTSPARLARAGVSSSAVALANPLSSNDTHLIPSHLPLLLETMAEVNTGEEELILFEVGHVFSPPHTEEERVSILLRSGKWNHEQLVSKAKQFVAAASQAAGVTVTPEIHVVSEKIVSAFKIRRGRTLVFCSFSFSELLKPAAQSFFTPLPPFPVTTRDHTITVAETTPWSTVVEMIEKSRPATLLSWEHLDTYRSKELGNDKKSLTMRFRYSSLESTLTDEEITQATSTIERALQPLSI